LIAKLWLKSKKSKITDNHVKIKIYDIQFPPLQGGGGQQWLMSDGLRHRQPAHCILVHYSPQLPVIAMPKPSRQMASSN
jgi:hypothetical protein